MNNSGRFLQVLWEKRLARHMATDLGQHEVLF